jgi:5-oxoprolinase (ATP-hydrolysing)
MQVEFLRPMMAGILSERRSVPPFGLAGGSPGEKGLNLLVRSNGRVVNLGGKATVQLHEGDILQINTPGAGGYGTVDADGNSALHTKKECSAPAFSVVGSVQGYRHLQETA